MIFGFTAIALAAQLAVLPAEIAGHELRQEAQYRAYGHPPPCGNGFDLDARDGMCYPNGMVPPQFQTGRRYYGGGGGGGYGRYPVPCGMAPTSISATGCATRTEWSRLNFSRAASIRGSRATTTITTIGPGGATIANIDGLDSRSAAATFRYSR